MSLAPEFNVVMLATLNAGSLSDNRTEVKMPLCFPRSRTVDALFKEVSSAELNREGALRGKRGVFELDGLRVNEYLSGYPVSGCHINEESSHSGSRARLLMRNALHALRECLVALNLTSSAIPRELPNAIEGKD